MRWRKKHHIARFNVYRMKRNRFENLSWKNQQASDTWIRHSLLSDEFRCLLLCLSDAPHYVQTLNWIFFLLPFAIQLNFVFIPLFLNWNWSLWRLEKKKKCLETKKKKSSIWWRRMLLLMRLPFHWTLNSKKLWANWWFMTFDRWSWKIAYE